ncbi:hypothetical protein [Pseudoxanthomonas suwonensis]|jgi:hypothetical protein|uniref:hypothetical protein n=1 Tax=Pseudoxanthomonas suwonensis TaxID=314722 RepID=UPI0004630DF8|nr:hypothetical protein [Pseudoxanthomonas suwonensis]
MNRPTLLLAVMLAATQPAALARADTPPLPGDATSTCGWVTGERPAVPRSQDIFRVEITRIDGDSTPLHPVPRHRVQPGQRVLTVTDHIDTHRLPGAAIAQIERMKKLEMQRAYKTFTVDVKPGVSYAIGARLLRDRLDAQSIRDNAYWEPVVWDERAERCP